MYKILVAEDDAFLSKVYQLKLSNKEFNVKIASNGVEALDMMKNFIPDIVILDLIMPQMDGFTVLEEMKKNDDLKNIPVLVATNLGQTEDFEHAKSLGASDYIIKSDLAMSDIIKKIHSLILQSTIQK